MAGPSRASAFFFGRKPLVAIRKLKKYRPTRFMAKTSHYDKEAADYAVMFIESLCHTKGTWAGKPFELIDWQEQIIRDLFGVLKENGYRQFNTAYIEIPKKQGKSELAAAVALLLVLEILLSLLGHDIRGEVALFVAFQLLGNVNRQEGLTCENLATGTLEVMVDHLHTVEFSVYKLLSNLLGYLYTSCNIWLVGKVVEVASSAEAHLSCLLSHLATNRIYQYVVLAKVIVLLGCLSHHLDNIGIEATTKTGVRAVDHECHVLDRSFLTEDSGGISLTCEESLENVL